jgi:putative nucleotidyltransferase with HDIG domain
VEKDWRKKWNDLRGRAERAFAVASSWFEGRRLGDFVPDRTLRRRKTVSRFLYCGVFAALSAWILTSPGPRPIQLPTIQAGEIADLNIYAPLTVDMQLRDPAPAKREELARQVAPIFDYDDNLLDVWLQNWREAFRRLRNEYYAKSARAAEDGPVAIEKIERRIEEITGQRLPTKILLYLHQQRFDEDIERTFVELAQPLLRKIIAKDDLFPSYYSTGIVVRQLNQGLNETRIYDLSRIWSLETARDLLRNLHLSRRPKKPDRRYELEARTVELVQTALIPNLTFNDAATQKSIAAFVGGTKQPMQSLRRGEVFIRRGERVTEQQAQMLEDLRQLMEPRARFRVFLFSFAILFIFLSALLRFDITRRSFWRLPLKDALLFAAITLVTFLSLKYALPFLRIFFSQFGVAFGVEYLMPVAAGGLIVHLLMGKETAYAYALLMGIGAGLLLDRSFFFSLWAFAVTVTAIQSIRSCKQRTDLYRCGLTSGTVGALLVIAFAALHVLGHQKFELKPLAVSVFLSFLSGLFAAGLTASIVPIVEALFGYTTNLKLLELANFNHPLLHELMMKAPGTYHHSVIVGSLAEIAADRVKANALLARVSAYYHDIGKMTKPMYFIENQAPNNNPHDHLAPSMSAKILHSHVKHGVRMGREHQLGSTIIDVIEQHHGTTLTSYFFSKAKRNEKPDDPVRENEFRYPGPRPQTREAAIVMICDSCEAATRSIPDPSPQKIQSMVGGIIQKRLLDDQFDECDLTLADLKLIEESVSRTLVSLYHHRIEYPGQPQAQPTATVTPIPIPGDASRS